MDISSCRVSSASPCSRPPMPRSTHSSRATRRRRSTRGKHFWFLPPSQLPAAHAALTALRRARDRGGARCAGLARADPRPHPDRAEHPAVRPPSRRPAHRRPRSPESRPDRAPLVHPPRRHLPERRDRDRSGQRVGVARLAPRAPTALPRPRHRRADADRRAHHDAGDPPPLASTGTGARAARRPASGALPAGPQHGRQPQPRRHGGCCTTAWVSPITRAVGRRRSSTRSRSTPLFGVPSPGYQESMAPKVQPVPEHLHTVTPRLVFRDEGAAGAALLHRGIRSRGARRAGLRGRSGDPR